MAGMPKRRARREAAIAAGLLPAPPPRTSSWAPTPMPPSLSSWWGELMKLIQASHERLELLRSHVMQVEHPHAVYAQEVRMWGALGTQRDVIARLIGMSENQMMQCYGADYEVGSAEILAHVSANMTRIATSNTGDDRSAVKAATEILNRRGGEEWRAPAQKIEVDSRPKPNVIDSSKLTYEERQALKAIIERAVARRAEGENGV